MNVAQYDFAQLIKATPFPDGVSYLFSSVAGDFALASSDCKYPDGTQWDPLGLHVGFTIRRRKQWGGLPNVGWEPALIQHQPPPPKEYETHLFNGIAFEIEKGAHWEVEFAVQVESLQLLREIRDLLRSINNNIMDVETAVQHSTR